MTSRAVGLLKTCGGSAIITMANGILDGGTSKWHQLYPEMDKTTWEHSQFLKYKLTMVA